MNFLDPKVISLAVFVLAYVLFIFLSEKRTLIAVISAAILIISQALSFANPLPEAFFWFLKVVNWNVMGLFVGTLVVADIFMESRVPAYLAEIIVNKSKNIAWAIVFICLLTGFISAFVENVATVLIVTPIALSMAKKLKINPMNMMIAIAVSSNLQGTATLIGDPPSMLLGGFAKMNFFDFFFYKGRPSIFFAVEIGCIASLIVLYFIFRKHNQKSEHIQEERVKSWIPTILLVLLIVLLALSSLFDTEFSYAAGIICMIFGVISMLWKIFADKEHLFDGIKKMDWDTTLFLMSIFIIVGSLTENGWIILISDFLAGIVGNNVFFAFILLVSISVIISAFVDNVPYLAAMLPVAIALSSKVGVESSLLLFGLLIGASLGGNITPIGASANIVACGLLKKEGINVSFGDFMKIGIPFTIAAVTAACCFVWFVWGPS